MLRAFFKLVGFFFLSLVPGLSWSYPELLSKNCMSCHSESSGYGILKHDGSFKIETPAWLLLGAKADLNQTFLRTPYEESGSFKTTRFEGQLGLKYAIDSYLSAHAQGSLNRVEPQTKSDSISDYVYSPYRFIELSYDDPKGSIISFKHGYYRNEWQDQLFSFSHSFKQTEFIFYHTDHQFNLGFQTKAKNYNSVSDRDVGFMSYKYFLENKINLIISQEQGDDEQNSSLIFVLPKNERLTFVSLLSQPVRFGVKGFKGGIKPVYQWATFLKFYGFAEYLNNDLQSAKPRSIIYGLGADYLWFSQGLLSVIYSKTDDSVVINNPTEKVELNFHLYM